MNKTTGLKVEYVPPSKEGSEQEEHTRVVKFITLFAQVGFKELYLNSETNIKFDCSKKV